MNRININFETVVVSFWFQLNCLSLILDNWHGKTARWKQKLTTTVSKLRLIRLVQGDPICIGLSLCQNKQSVLLYLMCDRQRLDHKTNSSHVDK